MMKQWAISIEVLLWKPENREVRDFFNMECRPDYIGDLISGRKLSQISGFDSNSTFRGHYVGSSDPKLSAP